jgi:hypothetical protein
MNKFNPS